MWTQDIALEPGAAIAVGAHMKAVEQELVVIVVQPAQPRAAEQQPNVIVVQQP